MSIEELENLIYKHFVVKDLGVVRLICAVIIAHKFNEADPVWLFLIAPPSGLKSELIRGLKDVKDVYPLSSLTAQTFISGQKNYAKDNSLLKRIQNGILTFKDFTTVLQLYEAARQEILSQLREIYDGQYSKSFGTGDEIKWEGKITFIAGVTEAVDLYQGMYSILGERFLQYRMVQPDRIEATKQTVKNTLNSNTIRKEIIDGFGKFINQFLIPETLPDLPIDWEDEIIHLANFATIGRSGIKRDSKDREITNVFDPEMPMRFAKQLILLAKTFSLIGYKDDDRKIIRKIAIDSLPKNRIKALKILSQPADKTLQESDEFITVESENKSETCTTANIATQLALPTTTTRRTLEDLNALGFLHRDKLTEAKSSPDLWKLNSDWRELINSLTPFM